MEYRVFGRDRLFREGDCAIHRRNNYDLNVFNGDIGKIGAIDNQQLTCVVAFYLDGRATAGYQFARNCVD